MTVASLMVGSCTPHFTILLNWKQSAVVSKPLHILRITPHFLRPKLAPVAYDPCGGLQVQSRRLTQALDRGTIRQTVLTSRLPGSARKENLANGTEIHSVGPVLPEWLVPWALSLTWGIAVLAQLWRQRRTVDLIHIHLNHWLWCRILIVAARTIGLPTVVKASTDLWVAQNNRFVRHIGHWIDGFALRRASHVITLTESCARKMRFSYGFTTEQATVIPDAIDLSAFCANLSPIQIEAFRQRFAIPNDRNIVLYLGRIRSEKGWQDLPDVARALGPQDFLLICGDGPDRAKLKTAMARACPDDRWRITGFVDQLQARIALEVADILILPSRREAFGGFLLEAMACGIPAVSYRIGGIPELAGNPAAIRLIEPGDTAAFTSAVCHLLSDPAERELLTQRGQDRVSDFGLDDATASVLSVYAKVMATPHATINRLKSLQKPDSQMTR